MAERKLLKVNQVARMLQMNRMTIYKLAKAGKLPAVKIGSEWRFDEEELQNWVNLYLEPEQTKGKALKKAAKARVLVVDDDPGIRDLFVKILRDAEYKVYTASSGREAIESMKKYKPQVIFLDLKMADIDGIDTLRLIKKYNKHIPVIMVTAYATMNTAIEAMKLGAYDYLAKPFDNDKIINLAGKASRTYRGRAEAE